MKLTIKEIAKLAGVSSTTVSQILNQKGERFSEKTKQKVMKVIEENDYKPDFFAQNLITKKSNTIGMIVPDVSDFFFSKIVEGVEQYFASSEYMILLCNSGHEKEKEQKLIEELVHRSVDGIIMATPNDVDHKNFSLYQREKPIPLVLIDRGKNKRKQGNIIVREYEGAYRAIEWLIQSGHRQIAMIREKENYYRLPERTLAYLDCLEAYQLSCDTNRIVEADLTMNGGYEATQKLLDTTHFTALFCGNDAMAVGAYRAIGDAGLKIPEDVSVIGFDGLSLTSFLVPSLTTIEQPTFEIGMCAAQFLEKKIECPKEPIANRSFATKFIVRESTQIIDIQNLKC